MRQIILTDFLILTGCILCIAPLLIAKEMGHLSSGTAVGLLFLVVAVGLSSVLIVSWRRTRRDCELFVNTHRSLPDPEFLRQMGASGDYSRFCLIVRFGFAIDCGVPPEMIHPSDTVRELERLCFDGFFLHEIIFALEREFPKQVADIRLLQIFKNWKTIAFRDCVEGAARELGFLPGTRNGSARRAGTSVASYPL